MFWFIFILIILFIIFLIVLLISSSQVSVPRRREKIKRREKKEPKAKTAPTQPKQKVKEVTPPKEEQLVTVTEEVVEPIVEVEPTVEPEASIEAPTPEPEPIIEEVPEPELTTTAEEEIEPEAPTLEPFIVEEEFEESEIVEADTVADVEVPPEPIVEDTYDYATFDNTRTMEEFGLSREEANDFILDLITQVEEELVKLEAAVEAHDTKKIEDISHMIKGSATNLGTGGIADVLVDFNTYMKSASEPEVIASHMRNLHRAYDELKTQFS